MSEELVSIYDLVKESIDAADGDVATIHVDVLREVIHVFDNVKLALDRIRAAQKMCMYE